MSKKKSLTSEERVAAVQEYLDGKGGYKAIARKYNIGATTMKRMVCRAKTEGIESVAKASPYRHYTNEIKEAAVEDYLNGRILSSEDGFHGIIMARDLKSINAQKEDLP